MPPAGGPVPPGLSPWGPPVHQPGVVPLRPLTLGDIFGGALQTVRHNPKATVGLAAVVTFGFMLIPMLATVVFGAVGEVPSFDIAAEESAEADMANVALGVSTLGSALFSVLASIVVTGLIVRVVEAAVVGEKITAGEAWRRSRRRLPPLLGLTMLVFVGVIVVLGVTIGLGLAVGVATDSTLLAVLFGILGGLLGVVGTVFLFTRYLLLAPPSLVLEGRGVFASLARAGQLSRRGFWRLFGIYLLANLLTSAIAQVIAIPFGILSVVLLLVLPGGWAVVGMLLVTYISTVLTGALVSPFNAAVLALQYYDQRFRKEGLDIQLLNQSLRTQSPQTGPR